MAYEPLHHKYRPQTFKDLVGQEAIASTLTNAIEKQKIAPAYLFTGPRGTGKTSSARILAKSLNCLAFEKPTAHPCGKCEVCVAIANSNALDIVEIDAASNTGVDNIREIIERSRFAPVQSRYKVYAIDECHMLSTAAFNALLKTLEEPPPRVVFILATTDPQRVLSTIISRCQRFDYRRIPLDAMVKHLSFIAQEEQIKITDEALTLTAQIANGGLRDAESLLDQLSLFPEEIAVQQIWDFVGAVPERELLALLTAIRNEEIETILAQCRSLLDRGREPLVLLQNLASFYLHLLVAKTAPTRKDLVPVTETCWQDLVTEAQQWQVETILQGQQKLKEGEIQLKNTTQPRLWLEIVLLGLLPQADSPKIQPLPASIPQRQPVQLQQTEPIAKGNVESMQPLPASTSPKQPLQQTEPKSIAKADAEPIQALPQPPTAENSQTVGKPAVASAEVPVESAQLAPTEDSMAIWQQVINSIQPPMTQALLRQHCHLISLKENSAVIGIRSAPLHKMNQGKIPNIEAAFAKVCQRKVKVALEVAAPSENKEKTTKNTSPRQNTPTVKPASLPTPVAPAKKAEERSHLQPEQTLATQPPPKPLPNIESTALKDPKTSVGTSKVDVPTLEVSTATDATSDSLDLALELMAKKFDGEIIDLDSSKTKAIPVADTTKVEEQKVVIKREIDSDYNYDDDDVPF